MDDDDDGLKSDRCELDVEVDPAVTPELYRQWRAPRRGGANPERMNNPVWE